MDRVKFLPRFTHLKKTIIQRPFSSFFIGTPALHKALGFLNIKKIRLLLYYLLFFFNIFYSTLFSLLEQEQEQQEQEQEQQEQQQQYQQQQQQRQQQQQHANNFSPVEGQRRRYDDITQPIAPARKGEQQRNKQTNKQTIPA